MIALPYLDIDTPFPPVSEALDDPNGLLAFGADLSAQRLFSAYSSGIFPWFSDDEPLLWWSPNPRSIIELDDFVCSKSLRKLARQKRYKVTLNHAFDSVINACANIPRKNPNSQAPSQDTWITEDMQKAYSYLHQLGLAHSVEVWEGGQLVGGLYGVALRAAFFGESMFSRRTDASKIALVHLVARLRAGGFELLDAQFNNDHLLQFGIYELPRERFQQRLAHALSGTADLHLESDSRDLVDAMLAEARA